MENIKVSVIVLTYNHEKYIEQALDSILMQKVSFNYEILVGDDASTDATVPILLEYKKRYPDIIKLFLNKENVGATRNAYNLLMKAEGEYLATCEGDDYWTDENKLQLQVDFLEKHDEFVGCSHNFTIVNEEGISLNNQKLPWVKNNKTVFTLSDFNGIYLPGQPSTYVRRNILNNIDLNMLYRVHNMIGDRTLMLLYLMRGDFAIISRNMSCYRIKKKSVTKSIYGDYTKSIFVDYEITLKLEEIALMRNINLDTTPFKKMLFAKASLLYILSLNQNYLKICQDLYDRNKKLSYFLSIPNYISSIFRRII